MTAFDVTNISCSISKRDGQAAITFSTINGGSVAIVIDVEDIEDVLFDIKKVVGRLEEFADWIMGN